MPLECGIIFDGIPEGAIPRKVGLIWGIPGSSTLGYCGEDNKEARELAVESIKNFFGPGRPYVQDQKDIYARLLENWGGVPDHLQQNFRRYVELEEQEDEVVDLSGGGAVSYAIWNQLDTDALCDRGVVIGGDPESCIKALKLHEAAGCDQMMIMMQTEAIPHEKVMKSLELFGKNVIPEFKKSEEKAVNPGA